MQSKYLRYLDKGYSELATQNRWRSGPTRGTRLGYGPNLHLWLWRRARPRQSTGPSHEEMERIIYQELAELTSSENPLSFYYPKTRCNALTRFNHFVTMQDIPARDACIRTNKHNSNYGARDGWSCNLKQNSNNLPSCEMCHQYKCENPTGSRVECLSCCDWSYEKIHLCLPLSHQIIILKLNLVQNIQEEMVNPSIQGYIHRAYQVCCPCKRGTEE